jgi:autotransporter-associated beta strand protein
MNLLGSKKVCKRRALAWLLGVLSVVVVSQCAVPAYAQRVFGLDTSSAANVSAPSQTAWNNAFNDADGDGVAYKFAFVRSSRGGLTAAEARLDDSHFYDNISRATAAGMLAGSYHFARGDLAPTANPPGTNTGAGDANHYLERAGMYMKPGYLLPVFDMEDGNVEHSQASLTTWSMEWLNTIHNAKGIWPIVYTNSSYNNDEVGAELAWHNFGTTPKSNPRTFQWLARPSGSLISGKPGAATIYPNPYGAWDPNFVTRTNSRDPAVNPWAFWQNGAGSPNGFLIDFNAANGNIEFVKDFLVPALWTNAGSGDWGTTANWNSDNPTYNGTIQSGPAPRLPNNQSLDWVKLQHAGDGTVTISSGARTVRKFYTQQPLNITGGSLSVGYTPGSGGKWDLPSEFNAVVTLSGGAGYSAHTTQVDGGGGQFNINGGTVTFREIQLASHASNSGKIVMVGDGQFAQTGGIGTSVIRSIGSLLQAGSISLPAGNRTFNVNNGSASVDLNVRVGISDAGRLVKAGNGTMQLSNANTYSGGTTITTGVLQIAADDRLGAMPVSPQSNNVILDGGTLRTGAQINSVSLTNPGSGYTSFPTLSIGGAGASSHPASANVLAGISSIALTAGGSNYVNQTPSAPPAPNTAGTFVDIVGGGGTGATAYATVVGGVVTGITIANSGSGYTSIPTIHISSTISGGNLAGSGATANVNGITLQSIALNDGGFDYTTPTISLTGGGGAGATASATSSPNLTLNSNRGVSLTANGGTLNQTAGTTLTVGGLISSTGNGTLSKSGAGTLVLSGANSYAGATSVTAGVLSIAGASAGLGAGNVTVQGATSALSISSGVGDAIDDGATVNLFGGGTSGVADQGYADLGAGINEAVGSLLLNGVVQPNGTYGSSLSSATFKLNEYFAGLGILTVGPTIFAGDYNDDGTVDSADYVVWRKFQGTSAVLPNDPHGGTIGAAQFDTWRANYGQMEMPGSGANGGTVPEPSSIILLVLSIATLPARRRGR